MIKLKYYIYGDYIKEIRLSDKDFTIMLLTKSLEYSHTNKIGTWYKDCGLGVYLKK